MEVAGIVFVFSLVLKIIVTRTSKSAFVGSLTLRPRNSSTGDLPLVFEMFRCVISSLCLQECPKRQFEDKLEAPASLSELLSQLLQ